MNDARAQTLRRIAQVLDVPESAFFGSPSATRERFTMVTAGEVLELVDLLGMIADPKVRRACIDRIQAFVNEGNLKATG